MDISKISFHTHYMGRFINLLRWPQLDELWETLKAQPEGWYIYLVGEPIPSQPVDRLILNQFIQEINQLLRQEHDYDYCGIVYVDDKEKPTMIKIFDPNNLGASCGSCGSVILPRWLLSRIPPEPLHDQAPIPGNRKRWWQRFFSNN